MESLDLSNDLEGSTPILPPHTEEKITEKNVNKTIKMDSTPINDVMSGPADWETQSHVGGPPPQQFIMNQQPQRMTSSDSPMSHKLGISDEQMIALIVGVVTALASSKMVQEKLASVIPQVGSDPHGAIALGATGLVAAIIFYFAKRFIKV